MTTKSEPDKQNVGFTLRASNPLSTREVLEDTIASPSTRVVSCDGS